MHVTVGVYMNGQYKYNIVRDEDLENHIKYNKIFRFGRGLFVDGEMRQSRLSIRRTSKKLGEKDFRDGVRYIP